MITPAPKQPNQQRGRKMQVVPNSGVEAVLVRLVLIAFERTCRFERNGVKAAQCCGEHDLVSAKWGSAARRMRAIP
jgi:hypothetical protein